MIFSRQKPIQMNRGNIIFYYLLCGMKLNDKHSEVIYFNEAHLRALQNIIRSR